MWLLGKRSETVASFKSTIENLSLSHRINVSRWLCASSLNEGCTDIARTSCQVLSSTAEAKTGAFNDLTTESVYIEARQCLEGDGFDSTKLGEKLNSVQGKSYADALAKLHSNKPTEASALLNELVKNENSEDPSRYYFLAQARLTEIAKSVSDLDRIASLWKEQVHEEGWQKLGHALVSAYSAKRHYKQALEVGKELVATEPQNVELSRTLVVAAYQAGLKTDASKLLKSAIVSQSSRNDRTPASMSEFDRVRRDLEKGKAAP